MLKILKSFFSRLFKRKKKLPSLNFKITNHACHRFKKRFETELMHFMQEGFADNLPYDDVREVVKDHLTKLYRNNDLTIADEDKHKSFKAPKKYFTSTDEVWILEFYKRTDQNNIDDSIVNIKVVTCWKKDIPDPLKGNQLQLAMMKAKKQCQ